VTGGANVAPALLVDLYESATNGDDVRVKDLQQSLRELGAIYRARVRGEEPDLPDPGVQYPAYAYRERTLRDRPELAQELAWWREHLSGIPVALDLPTDRPRPRVPTYRGATRRSRLGDDIEAALRSFCRTEGVTVFATLLAAFDALLARLS